MLQERRIKIENMTQFEVGYLAGIIDGEGCINITNGRRKSGKRIGERVWIARLHIVTTDILLVNWLKDKIGVGSYYQERRKKPRPNHKQVYVFVISAILDLYAVLKAISPFLIIKKAKALECIEDLEYKINKNHIQT
jgi:hypothetical protein